MSAYVYVAQLLLMGSLVAGTHWTDRVGCMHMPAYVFRTQPPCSGINTWEQWVSCILRATVLILP